MSALYGFVEGNRGPATRGGSKNSGLRVAAQSYDGSLITFMDYDNDDKLRVELRVREGSGAYGGDEIFRGSLEDLTKICTKFMKKQRRV